jgi:hypothetical protein
MNITQTFIQLDRELRFEGLTNVAYQNAGSYMELAISDWLKLLKLNLGEFNRIGLQESEEQKWDFSDADVRCFKVCTVCIKLDFKSLSQFCNAEVTHNYFKRKYIEGFKRFDAHFALNLTPELETFLDDYFKNGYVYEKEMKSKRVNGLKYQVLKQYKYDVFNLVLRVLDKSGALLKETILQSCKPDPFLVHYNVNKVNILDGKIEVLGSTGKLETEHAIERVLH